MIAERVSVMSGIVPAAAAKTEPGSDSHAVRIDAELPQAFGELFGSLVAGEQQVPVRIPPAHPRQIASHVPAMPDAQFETELRNRITPLLIRFHPHEVV